MMYGQKIKDDVKNGTMYNTTYKKQVHSKSAMGKINTAERYKAVKRSSTKPCVRDL